MWTDPRLREIDNQKFIAIEKRVHNIRTFYCDVKITFSNERHRIFSISYSERFSFLKEWLSSGRYLNFFTQTFAYYIKINVFHQMYECRLNDFFFLIQIWTISTACHRTPLAKNVFRQWVECCHFLVHLKNNFVLIPKRVRNNLKKYYSNTLLSTQ